jgi:hypothetical protein
VVVRKGEGAPKRNLTPLSIRFEPEIKATIERLAKADRRSVASWVEKYVIDHMQNEGLLPNADGGADPVE